MNAGDLPPPSSLQSILNFTGYYAGSWEMALPDDLYVRSKEKFYTSMIIDVLNCFPWGTLAGAEIALRNGTLVKWKKAGEEYMKWYREHVSIPQENRGFELILDANLFWQSPDGMVGRWNIGQAAKIMLADPGDSGYLDVRFYPNVFTDIVRAPRRDSTGRVLELEYFPFADAAKQNRDLMRSTLEQLERTVGLEITSWESERVEGIEKYGFSELAKPIDH